jgi:hypothetical protein
MVPQNEKKAEERRGSQALAVSVALGTLGVLFGAAILLTAVVWRTGLSLVSSRSCVTVK